MIRVAAALALLVASAASSAGAPQSKAAAQAEIWAKEVAIYAACGRGDLGPYIDNVGGDYLAWPPRVSAPAGVDSLRALAKKMAADDREVISVTPVAFSLNGDAAVIYYRTHRTQLPDGTVTDERFDVIHSWVRERGRWRLLGGMARPAVPAR